MGDADLLERVQLQWTKEIIGLWQVDYAPRLNALGLFSVRGRLLRADIIIQVWKIFSGLSLMRPFSSYFPSPHTLGSEEIDTEYLYPTATQKYAGDTVVSNAVINHNGIFNCCFPQ